MSRPYGEDMVKQRQVINFYARFGPKILVFKKKQALMACGAWGIRYFIRLQRGLGITFI